MKNKLLSLFCVLLLANSAFSQLAKDNSCKFLGNITTNGQVRSDFDTLWNQITPENESKWASIERTRDVMTWSGCDAAYNYAKQHNILFKFHTLVWGSQYPTWMDNLSESEQLEEITEWMDAIQKRYPDLEMIDVVNEAVPGHAPAPYKNALGGDGTSGYDWIVTAFKMARERWPNAILIYNDYNTFQWQINECIDLMQNIIKAGAPVDAFGAQAHDLNDMGADQFRTALEKLHDGIGLPIYITEYDIAKDDDEEQLTRYKEQIPIMWEADYVAGVTLWGYVYGSTWTTNGNSGLIRNGEDRPAFTWLKEYMKTQAAIDATSPVCADMQVYLRIGSETIYKGEAVTLTVNASTKEGEITKVEFYEGETKLEELTSAPYSINWTPSEKGTFELKAIAYNSNGLQDECTISVEVIESLVFNMENGILVIEAESMPETGGPYIGGYSDNFEGMAYYANGDYTQARFSVDGDDLQDYNVAVTGCSDATVAAAVELYIDETLVKKLSWNSNTPCDVTNVVSLSNTSAHTLQLLLVGDYGQSDVFIDKVTISKVEDQSGEDPTGFEDIDNGQIKVYPNPASEFVTINGVSDLIDAELIDLSGRVLKKYSSNRISLFDINEGIYLLRINAATKVQMTKIIVKK